MKIKFLLLACCFLFVKNSIGKTRNSLQTTDESAGSVLLKTADALNSLKEVRYNYNIELNYASENYLSISDYETYLDFTGADNAIGFKYQAEDSSMKMVYNGTEMFTLNKKEKTIAVDNNPQNGTYSFLLNSVVTLRSLLPIIVADTALPKTLTDTTINGTACFAATVWFNKTTFNNFYGTLDTQKLRKPVILTIIIDKTSYLPLQVVQLNEVNTDFMRSTFTYTATQTPAEFSWFYSTYTSEYKPAVEKERLKIIATGAKAPNFTLPFYNTNKSFDLSKLKGKIVLLDFWIKNCGPCIESVPHINDLQAKYKSKNVEIVSINAYDTRKEVEWFCNKHQTTYTVVTNGKDVAEKYGVDAFPSFVILDKKGNVLYSNAGFNQQEIEAVLQTNL